MTTGATHTKGSYETIDASTPEGIVGLWIGFSAASASRFLVDIAVGATPDMVVPNILWNRRTVAGGGMLYLPISIPAGAALKARAQSQATVSGQTIEVTVLYRIGSLVVPASCGGVQCFGASTAATRGTAIDPGGTVHTKGSWVQLSAAVGKKIRQLFLMLGNGAPTSISDYGHAQWLIDIGIGAASSEQVVIGAIPARRDGSTDCIEPVYIGPFDVAIVSTERLAVRAQCSTTSTANASDREFDIAILGIS